MNIAFNYHKETDTWDATFGSWQFTLTRDDMKHLDFIVGVELMETDPDFQKYVEEQSKQPQPRGTELIVNGVRYCHICRAKTKSIYDKKCEECKKL